MGSERDHGSKYSSKMSHRLEANAKITQDRIAALRALDKAGRMTKEAAARIQSSADRTGKNSDFKSRAMSAAADNES